MRSFLTLDVFFATLLLISLLMAIGWGRMRRDVELERVAETRSLLRELQEKGASDVSKAKDGWGRKLILDDTGKRAISFGADGLPGGSGFDADIRSDDR